MLKILKFGGTSVATLEKIRSVAEIVKKHKKSGDDVVVVISAMAGFTNKMVSYTSSFANASDMSKSMVHSCGEQITTGLLTAALDEVEVPSFPLLGWQVPIITSKNPFNSHIEKIETENLTNILKQGKVPVVAGFQGITQDGVVSTLGRGGSDTSAVAIGVALKADYCYIYTDVDGVYNKDPNACKDSILFKEIDYNKMVEMSKAGAKVVHTRAALLSEANNLKTVVLSTFNQEAKGTLIQNKKDLTKNCLESNRIKSVVPSSDFALVNICGVKDVNSALNTIFNIFSKECISVDMLTYSACNEGSYNINFMLEKESLNTALLLLDESKPILNYNKIHYNSSVKKISVIGHYLISSCSFLSFLFSVLKDENIKAELLWTSESRISVAIDDKNAEIILEKIYNKYNLER